MDPNWVAAVASLASAFVVAMTAIAAFVQIRHAQNANEITVYLRLVERLDSLETASALAKIDSYVERMHTDPAFRAELQRPGPIEGFTEIAGLLRFLEHLSTLVITGGVTERLILAEYADNIVSLWDKLHEVMYLRRIGLGKYVCAALEHLAMRAKEYLDSGEMDRLYGNLRHDPRMIALAERDAQAITPS